MSKDDDATKPPKDPSESLTREAEIIEMAPDLGTLPEGREKRVRQIMWLMSSGRWVRGKTGEILEALWGVSHDMMRNYAAEASRRVKSTGDAAFVQERLTVALDEELDTARGDPKAVAVVAKAFADIAHVTQPASVNVILQSPLLGFILNGIREALAAFPEAQAAVEAKLIELSEQHAAMKKLGGG